MFFAPTKTFEDIRRNASWWAAWVVTGIFLVALGVTVVQKVDLQRFIQQQIERSPSAQRRLENLTPEQRERGIAIQATGTKIAFDAYPVITLVGGLLIAATLMAIFNFILGAEVSFQRAMAIVFYSYVPWIIATILLTVSLLVSSDANSIDLTNAMPTNPAFFMDPLGNKFIYAIAYSIDIFNIWALTLMGIGFSVVSANRKPNRGTAITTMFVVFGLYALGRAVWRSVF